MNLLLACNTSFNMDFHIFRHCIMHISREIFVHDSGSLEFNKNRTFEDSIYEVGFFLQTFCDYCGKMRPPSIFVSMLQFDLKHVKYLLSEALTEMLPYVIFEQANPYQTPFPSVNSDFQPYSCKCWDTSKTQDFHVY